MKINNYKIHDSIRKRLGYKKKISDKEIIEEWKSRVSQICKPCWEVKYCPFGPMVEEFPLMPIVRKEADEHNEYLKKCLQSGKLADGRELDKERKVLFAEEVDSFNAKDYPEKIPSVFKEASCRVFGHICPVFYVAEAITETKERRKHSRSIPRDVMLKVVRRDGQICSNCNIPVPDDEVEFDHVIPYSKGGSTSVENLRLVHRNCNRTKGSSLNEILHPYPIEHVIELKEENTSKSK